MENFTYVNIFETKGIEYLFVVGFLFMFLLYLKFNVFKPKSADSKNSGKVRVTNRSKNELAKAVKES